VPGTAGPGAWAGALLFAVSIAAFLFSYAFTFAGQPTSSHPARDTAVNLLLFTAFAMHHSLFARTRVRGWVARTVPGASERTLFVCAASVLLLLVCWLWRLLPGTVWHVDGAPSVLMHAIQIAGIALVISSAAVVGVSDLAGLSSSHASAEVRSQGPYRWIRHPIYAGWLLLTFAVPLMSMTRFVFAVASATYLLIAIPLEERTLRRMAPEGYARYATQVKWRLLPGVF
jgi:methanethiol S-methyltransferase